MIVKVVSYIERKRDANEMRGEVFWRHVRCAVKATISLTSLKSSQIFEFSRVFVVL